jgi:hypothetical protein
LCAALNSNTWRYIANRPCPDISGQDHVAPEHLLPVLREWACGCDALHSVLSDCGCRFCGQRGCTRKVAEQSSDVATHAIGSYQGDSKS